MNLTKESFILISVFAICCSCFTTKGKLNSLSYEEARNAVMDAEDLLSTGGTILLSQKEQLVNRIFMKHKLAELSEGFLENDETYAPGMHFFKAKKLIEKSKVFQFLQEMPKGALLHAHNSALVSSEWVIRNLTYMPGLLSCVDNSGVTVFTFRKSPIKHDCNSSYSLVSLRRQKSWNKTEFDKELEKTINLYTPFPEVEYSSLNKVWAKFQNVFNSISDVLKYIPAFRTYHWRLLEELYHDGIMYLELRMEFKTLYDEEGEEYPPQFAANELIAIVQRFRALYPDFLGVKVIYSTNRKVDQKRVSNKLEAFKKFHQEYPKFVIGFDLVGQEDLGNSLYDFIEELKELPETAKYFFHAGETNWFGSSSDYNLLDAILLNSTRIGHGYALVKHPVLWNAVKKRDIALEVSPISNQVLNLVWDLRNHPGAFFISENMPIVITSDDPGFWNTKGLSYDFYYAIMSFAPNHAGLKTLKQLVWNSIKYSVLNEYERKEAYALLDQKWDEFLDRIIENDV
ncbi:adenosine deaminase 2 [Episyrphus balteatus]|uniref:adenosine deaminase 2 n=1 Tax=Episyrphus balteatus TaxID=286459 RepID=UPI0024854C43|nr:adenosine deaminase 2 [Episyrphus balteatus]XP_055849823.1 adenosine deaminase 2 [Episyrphus balteatus]XP_055849824.1 adenosine deaminase 2 [Episyrphus balteatus]